MFKVIICNQIVFVEMSFKSF